MFLPKRFLIIVALVSVFFSGCAVFLIGAGVAGGYAISKDAMEFNSDRNFNSVWDSAVHVLDIMGTIKSKDFQKGRIEADVDASHVIVRIESITNQSTRLRVSARRYLMPNLNLAQKVLNKIIQNTK